ncbi:MAG: AraC family transcriptional regulator [Armatimonadota bacterium]
MATDFPQNWIVLRRVCRRIVQAVPSIGLADHHIRLLECKPYRMLPGWKMGVHAHSFYEASILLKGEAVYASIPPQRLGPGHLVCYSPHTPHAWGTPDSECLRLVLWFQVEPDLTIPTPPHWPCWPEQLDDIQRLLTIAGEAAPGWPDQAAAWIGVIISRLLTLGACRSQHAHETPLIAPIDSALQFIEDNLDRPLTLADVAAHAGMSVPHLTRTFKQATGESVIECLVNLRMDRAAVLLTETDRSLSDIARQSGLPDVSYFCRRFRRHFGTTPLAYRQTVLQDADIRDGSDSERL